MVLITTEVAFHVAEDHSDIAGGEISVTDHYGGSTNAWKGNKKHCHIQGAALSVFVPACPVGPYDFTHSPKDTLSIF